MSVEFIKYKSGKTIVAGKVEEVIRWFPLAEGLQDDLKFVYCLIDHTTKRCKIGIAECVEERIKAIQATCPSELSLCVCIPCWGNNLETFIHRQLRYLRLHGEWFSVTDDLVSFLQDLISKHEQAEKEFNACKI